MTVDVLTVGEAMAAFRSDSMIRSGAHCPSPSPVPSRTSRSAWPGSATGFAGSAASVTTSSALSCCGPCAPRASTSTCVEVCAGELTGMVLFETAPAVRDACTTDAAPALPGTSPLTMSVDAVRRAHGSCTSPGSPRPWAASARAVSARSRPLTKRAPWSPSTSTSGPSCGQRRSSRRASTAAAARGRPRRLGERGLAGGGGARRGGAGRGTARARHREVVIKRGDRGARLLLTGGAHSAPAVRVPVVDPVGAGDAFTAGYLSGLLDGLPVVDGSCALSRSAPPPWPRPATGRASHARSSSTRSRTTRSCDEDSRRTPGVPPTSSLARVLAGSTTACSWSTSSPGGCSRPMATRPGPLDPAAGPAAGGGRPHRREQRHVDRRGRDRHRPALVVRGPRVAGATRGRRVPASHERRVLRPRRPVLGGVHGLGRHTWRRRAVPD